ncbi:MAG TPA: D-alanyl-lipoteichoic acid biosynthesis protein DltD [Anaerolineales bacterium]|nr:D-alanyl-lipoteichoic acid biosynthesis protein DltD [Anaerolineales bacterium]
MRSTSHLQAGIVSILVLLAALMGFDYYARSLEQRYVNALAPLDLAQTINGIALQRAAFAQADLLPFFGSSEITMIDTPYDAERFFATYPTGFTVFQVANLGAASLTMAQDLAALGPDLRGKKIVISFSPATFTMSKLPPDYYAGNFSALHAYEMIFSPFLSITLKIDAARRMLDFPATLQSDAFLQFAIFQMTRPSRADRSLYYLSWPLGELQIMTMRLQDHAEVVSYLWSHPVPAVVRKIPEAIDWPAAFSSALAEQEQHTRSNSLGVEDQDWWWYQHVVTNPIPAGSQDKGFIARVEAHPEWIDLDILLRVLQELGAKPLILGRPMNVRLWEALGVSERAQETYYLKLDDVVNQYHLPLVDYRRYGTDIYFSIDQGAHTSRLGWVYVDQTLDEFFHGQILP